MKQAIDRRLFPCNERVAHVSLRGQVDNVQFVEGRLAHVRSSVLGLRRSPCGDRDRQLLHGAGFLVLDEEGAKGTVFGRACADGYVGYVARDGLEDFRAPSHRVWSLGAHVYPEPVIKVEPVMTLPFFSVVEASDETESFIEIANGGYIPTAQVKTVNDLATDPVEVAERLVGTPYLWGGDSNWGIDCSGLVQLALASAGIDAPRDSDMQEHNVGTVLDGRDRMRRGDFVFWSGHVGIMVDSEHLVHANAHHMAVRIEPLEGAAARIQATGGGAIRLRRRI
ncbi:MAG: NlpC/P60 family protein [Rhodobacteraceae bacterium]|nr:NlpC/P60 family protein [Paracoccaceae bacterium]